jgi:hypothetical protein
MDPRRTLDTTLPPSITMVSRAQVYRRTKQLRPLVDQRLGLASAAIRSVMAASNWLAEAANINPVSS